MHKKLYKNNVKKNWNKILIDKYKEYRKNLQMYRIMKDGLLTCIALGP